MVTSLPADFEMACQVIERLELHRQCLDEALADAYEDLLALLDSPEEGPEGRPQGRPERGPEQESAEGG